MRWGGSSLKEHDHFAQMLEELAPLLSELPRGDSQEIVRSLTGIARLLDDLDVARAELERKLALIEAEKIIAAGWSEIA
ncbi:MAG: hypothetical protein WBB22_09880 [Anaerolineae bacterium]